MAILEFTSVKSNEIQKLKDLFCHIATNKERGSLDDVHCHNLLDNKISTHFPSLPPKDIEKLIKKWRKNPKTKIPWDFGSWFDAIESAEVKYIELQIGPSGSGKLIFEQLAHPSGGIDATEKMIKIFGGKIVSNDAL